MTLRDEFAKAAMAGELAAMRPSQDDSSPPDGFEVTDGDLRTFARHWYRIADAMMAVRDEPKRPSPLPSNQP